MAGERQAPSGTLDHALRLLLLPLAALKLLAGLVGALLAPSLLQPQPGAPIPAAVHLLTIVVFGAAAAWLIFGGSDRRALYLGAVFVFVAVAFSERLVVAGLAGEPAAWLATAISLGDRLQLEAFLPFAFWLFARDFPQIAPFSRPTRLAAAMARAALGAGALLFAANLLAGLVSGLPGPLAGILRRLERSDYGLFWTVVFALTLPALGVIVWKARRAVAEERRRAGLFVAALAVGMGPLFLEVLLEALIPPYARFIRRPSSLLVGGLIFYPLLLSIPLTTAYSVMVHRVLAVRLIVRRAIEYLLARYAVVALVALPFAGLLIYLWVHRQEPVGRLLSGPGALFLIGATTVGLIALRGRRRLLETIDRRFFREQYDARQILANLVRRSRSAGSPGALAELLERELDRALHLDAVAVLTLDRPSRTYVSATGRARPLAAESALGGLAAGSSEPFDVDLEGGGRALERLPESDRRWLADGGFRLLIPLLGSDGAALGLIALGGKKSELPYSKEDLSLLADVGASGSLALEHILMVTSAPSATGEGEGVGGRRPPAEESEGAAECAGCGVLHPAGTEGCSVCGGPLSAARAPYVLLGKFRLERRLGAGGMGVVYRAEDLVLGRRVAIKTLPQLSPERSLRMRREARAMAAVTHPALAAIFGAETWRGTPMLVFELLEGGSLAERLTGSRLPVAEALGLGASLAEAVAVLHQAGILHRDIKPSNIGFTAAGEPKLLDFGLARMLEERDDAPDGAGGGREVAMSSEQTATQVIETRAGRAVGTPLYMSPEATRGMPPEPGFDLWGLVLVLYESIAGRNPFAGDTVERTRERILAASPPDLRELRSDAPAAVAEYFALALGANPGARPSSARELAGRLQELGGRAATA